MNNAFKSNAFTRFAWFVVGYNVLVIVWGALVRASKSGDGCGSHWPLCNGETVPVAPTVKTVIEFLHRVSTGLDGILVVALVVWAFVAFRRNFAVRLAAAMSLFFILTEGAIGALLVKFELVAGNVSLNRAVVMSLHLVNTLILMLFLTLTAQLANNRNEPKSRVDWPRAFGFAIGLLLLVLVGMSGAISALGHTLFPGHELAQNIAADNSVLLQIFLWLQLWHPFLSIAASLYLISIVQPLRRLRKNLTTTTLVLIAAQIAFGAATLVFLAPIWMQLVHLTLAILLWIAVVALGAQTVVEQSPSAEIAPVLLAETA